MADLIGRQLGQYIIAELIGRGGMANVYRARQESMDRDVAIKVMASDLTTNAEFVARFEREARVIARLQHPHVLPVIDFGRSDDYVYLVMRLVTGGVLSDRLQQTELTIRQTDRFLTQIASALEYAHRSGVIHRDLKPTNVLLDEQDNAYLTDFGIAKMLAGSTSNYSLTATGRVMGTPAYMAPEQWRSDPVDARTDIYALGIMLYEMLLGALPFNSETPYGMMYKHFDQPPPTPRAVNPQLPDALEPVVMRALAKRPEDRYPSAELMASDFSAAVHLLTPNIVNQPLPRVSAEQIERATPPAARQDAAPSPPDVYRTERTATPYRAAMPANRPAQESLTDPPDSTPPQQEERRGGVVLLVALGFVVVAGAFVIVLLLTNGGDDDDANAVGDDDQTPIAVLTESTVTATSTVEQTATQAAAPGATDDTPTGNTVTAPQPTLTSSTRRTTSPTASATVQTSNTPDYDATASVRLAQAMTQTAASWAETSTDPGNGTLPPPPTSTRTPTATHTPTASPTLTPSATPSATRTPRPTVTRTPSHTPTQIACGSLPSWIEIGKGARTTLLPAVPTRVRRVPGTGADVVRSIPPGLMFDVVDGPRCANGIVWWQAAGWDADGRWSGWIGEGQNDSYWIEPYDSGPIDCPGALPPRLVPSERGRVALDPYAPNRVRSSPQVRSDNVIGRIDPGSIFDVISGPVCDTERHWRWWLVRDGALEGWTAEGNPDTYWLEPWP